MSNNIPPARNVKIKRTYAHPARDDGVRVLVDRLWPREVTTEDAALDQWEKELVPSAALGKWFGHDPARWEEFRQRYTDEVHNYPYQLCQLRALARKDPLTLVHSADDEVHSNAVVLRDLVLGRKIPSKSGAPASRN